MLYGKEINRLAEGAESGLEREKFHQGRLALLTIFYFLRG